MILIMNLDLLFNNEKHMLERTLNQFKLLFIHKIHIYIFHLPYLSTYSIQSLQTTKKKKNKKYLENTILVRILYLYCYYYHYIYRTFNVISYYLTEIPKKTS